MISLGAKLSTPNDITGGTPLHCLAQSNKKPVAFRIECARLLLEAGADPTVQDLYGGIPADYVEENVVGEAPMMSRFPALKNRSLKQVLMDAMPRNPLFDFIEEGNVDGIQAALDLRFMKPNDDLKDAKDRDGKTLLFSTMSKILNGNPDSSIMDKNNEDGPKATLQQLKDILKLLLEKGKLDPDDPDKDKNNLMYIVCKALSSQYTTESAKTTSSEYTIHLEETVLILLENNATLTEDTTLLLHDAARRGNVKMIRFFIETVGMDKNKKGRQGLTPLHFACRSGKIQALQLLIELGVDLNAQDDRGKTAMNAAVANDKTEIISILQKAMKG